MISYFSDNTVALGEDRDGEFCIFLLSLYFLKIVCPILSHLTSIVIQ